MWTSLSALRLEESVLANVLVCDGVAGGLVHRGSPTDDSLCCAGRSSFLRIFKSSRSSPSPNEERRAPGTGEPLTLPTESCRAQGTLRQN